MLSVLRGFTLGYLLILLSTNTPYHLDQNRFSYREAVFLFPSLNIIDIFIETILYKLNANIQFNFLLVDEKTSSSNRAIPEIPHRSPE